MSDFNETQRERVAFCQSCGRGLTAEERRVVGKAIYCEPCLEARIGSSAGSQAGAAGASAGSNPGYDAGYVPPSGSGAVPPPPVGGGVPNPGLAALLGFIPGVGAMYNGQYAKGIVHLLIFAVLTSLAEDHGFFGIFVAGWIVYQVIEAYHTARARRDGEPLPNPFGLNDIGERFGFGRSWAAGRPPQDGTYVPPVPPPPPPGGFPPPNTAWGGQQTGSAQPGGQSWGGPTETYGYAPGSNYGTDAGYGAGTSWASAPPPPPSGAVPPVNPYAQVPDPGFSSGLGRSRFPVGALWLIGLGVFFLVGNAGLFRAFPVHQLVPFLLIGVGVWIFVRRMTATGASLADDGTPAYRMRLASALRGSVWVMLVGVLFLLSSFHILSWNRSWPLFIIVAGLMTFLQRSVSRPIGPYPEYPYGGPPGAPPPQAGGPVSPATPSNPPESSTSIVPSRQRDEEER